MANLFFGKMNDPKQIEEKVYRTSDKGFLGSIQIGDYAFIKLEKEAQPAIVKRLWRLRDIQETEGNISAVFDEVCQFEPIQLLRFEALDLFVLNMNLLNKCNKQTKGLSFYQISLVDEALFDELVGTPETIKEYLNTPEHYRKIVKVADQEQIDPNSINVQFYKDGDSWLLAKAVFLGDDLWENYDSSQFNLFDTYGKKGTNTAKDKMYSYLSGMDIDVPMMGLWDLFCGSVNENTEIKKEKKTSIKRDDFIEYCMKNGVGRAASQYESGIRSLESELFLNIDDEFARDNCLSLQGKIEEYVKSIEDSQIGNRRNWNSYVKKYIEFKRSQQNADNATSDTSGEETEVHSTYSYALAKHAGINKVFYGTPGCGKSYYLENTVLVNEGIDTENNVFRTTFFQDYSNADFVGQILPIILPDGKVTYNIIPGPFTLALKCAIDNPDEKVALVIEELNRGNAPSIFGDIFQLLDREKGTSKYKITNVNIQAYLKKESLYDLNYIRIPANLYIFATMNTSDQNVFTLDTAFKRRWKYHYIPNDFDKDDTIGKMFVPGLNNITWETFVKRINEYIINHATTLTAEDKQLGKYFVEKSMLVEDSGDCSEDILKEFAHKVFEYLWTDVAKFNRSEWFIEEIRSFSGLLYKYINHEDVFVPELAALLPIYVPAEEEA